MEGIKNSDPISKIKSDLISGGDDKDEKKYISTSAFSKSKTIKRPFLQILHSSSAYKLSPINNMALKGGSTPSCAACKYRRRKCTSTCPLAPYFPANKPKMFQSVHRLFGVSNVTKILESLETKDQKDDAMKSIIYEAEMRDQIPVYGCPFIISQLSFQLQAAREELKHVNLQIATCKEHQSNRRVDHDSCYWPSPQQEFGGMCPSIDLQEVERAESIVPCRFFLNDDGGGIYAESLENDTRPVLGLELRSDIMSNHSLYSMHLKAQTSVFGIQKEPEILIQDYEGLRYNTAGEILIQDYEGLRYTAL